MPKRIPTTFDKEIVIVGQSYVYRGIPAGQSKQREISLDIKVGALQKDVKDAKRKLLENLERLGAHSAKGALLSVVGDYLKDRFDQVGKPKGITKHTYDEAYGIFHTHIIRYFGASFKIHDFDQKKFAQYCSEKYAEGLNLVNHRKVLTTFLKWCVQYDYLKYRAEISIPSQFSRDRRQREVLSEDELKALISHCDGPLLIYVSMYALMGMRNMEIMRLRWDEVDLEKNVIWVNPLNNRRRQQRAIPINRHVRSLLVAAQESRPYDHRNAWVFPALTANQKTGHASVTGGVRKSWTTALLKANLGRHFTPHDLRATFETFMNMNPNFTETQREKMAGAKIDVQSRIYVKMQAEHLRGLENSANVKGISEIFSKKLRGNPRGKSESKGKQSVATKRKKTKK